MLRTALLTTVLLSAALASAEAADDHPAADAAAPSAVATFHCLGVYWSPPGGEAGKQVLVKFRAVGDKAWREGLPMRYNPVQTPECQGDYRGSIVDLEPGAAYEIELTLEGTPTRATLKASTWSEAFPVASTVKCQSGATTLLVKQSGKPDGYVLYDGTGCTIDGANQVEFGITVDASYVILRGFTIRDVTQDGIRILQGHHIVVEQCDISKWGSADEGSFGVDMNAAVYSKNHDVHALVVQRCRLHHPSWDSNSWAVEHQKSKHPGGPQTIVLWETAGNNVFRYNECWSDEKHYFNDVMGGAFNAGYRGFPGADSDIYGNYVADCWDDGLEIEGGDQNVRVWSNYIEHTMVTIADAACSIGPLYIWRNVGGRSYSPPGSEWGMTHGPFMKMGFANDEKWMTGHMYVFNNTLFQPNGEGPDGLGGSSRIIKHCVTRNNILQSRPTDSHSISTEKKSADNDFDHDLVSGRYPDGQEQHGIKGVPTYVAGAGFSFDSKTGDFRQAPDSPGVKKGIVIPNFCDASATPDLGAHDSGAPPIVYGVKAEYVPAGTKAKSKHAR